MDSERTMNVEGTYIDGAEWALYFLPSLAVRREGNTVYCFPEATQKESKNCGNCGKPTPEWACPDRTRDGSTITCYNCDATYTISIDVEQ